MTLERVTTEREQEQRVSKYCAIPRSGVIAGFGELRVQLDEAILEARFAVWKGSERPDGKTYFPGVSNVDGCPVLSQKSAIGSEIPKLSRILGISTGPDRGTAGVDFRFEGGQQTTRLEYLMSKEVFPMVRFLIPRSGGRYTLKGKQYTGKRGSFGPMMDTLFRIQTADEIAETRDRGGNIKVWRYVATLQAAHQHPPFERRLFN